MQDYTTENGIILPPQKLFIQVPLPFIRSQEFNLKEKMIYMYIWTYGITSKVGFPGQQRIAKDLGISVPTLIKGLDSLEEKNGLLRIHQVYEGTKEKSTCLYYLGEITDDGTFSKTYLNVIKELYPNKVRYIPKKNN